MGFEEYRFDPGRLWARMRREAEAKADATPKRCRADMQAKALGLAAHCAATAPLAIAELMLECDACRRCCGL